MGNEAFSWLEKRRNRRNIGRHDILGEDKGKTMNHLRAQLPASGNASPKPTMGLLMFQTRQALSC
jgi:hypothetical protein